MTQPYPEDMPASLQKALTENEEAHEAFFKMSASHQRQYIFWISIADNEKVAQERIQKMLQMITGA